MFEKVFIIITIIFGYHTACSASRIIDIEYPELRIFLPADSIATGTSVIICPGGAYGTLSKDSEGYDWTEFFNKRGVAAAVVSYRLPSGDRSKPIGDALSAMELMRDSAMRWNLDPERIGIMGFSAGGHLASTVATRCCKTARPAFQILFYPVISMSPGLTHKWTHHNLLGKDAKGKLEKEFSSEMNVTADTPRAVIFCSDDDLEVSPLNTIEYYRALKNHNVPVSVHIYPTGGHGWGFRDDFPHHHQMLQDLSEWLVFNEKSLHPD